MPRPRLVKEYDLRVTPPNGQDLEFPLDEFDQFIACKEFGHINKKKHYHIFCKTTMNDDEVKKYLRTVCDVEVATGNQLYRVKKAHEHTIGYVIKEFDVVASKGFTEDQLYRFKELSAEYRKKRETERKQKQKQKQASAVKICEEIVTELDQEAKQKCKFSVKLVYPTKEEVAAVVLHKILYKYKSEDEGLAPPRSTVERMIITIMMKLGYTAAVNEYYLPRCFQNSFS